MYYLIIYGFRSRDSYKTSKTFVRDRDLDKHLSEISRERTIRESSFERDMRAKDRIRTVAELPWEREKSESNVSKMKIPNKLFAFIVMYAAPRMPMDVYASSMMRDARSAAFMAADENDPDDGEVKILVDC